MIKVFEDSGKQLMSYDILKSLPKMAVITIQADLMDTNTAESILSDFRGTTGDDRAIIVFEYDGQSVEMNLGALYVSTEAAKLIGIAATKKCNEQGITIDRVNDLKWGKINAYPKQILAEVAKEFGIEVVA